MKDPKFAEYLAVFVEVVRAGSFSGASRRRAITPSAVMRQIDALEQDVGLPLLLRSTRALALTDAGTKLYERAQRILDDLADTHAEIAAFSGRVAGVLRIACFPTFGKRYVIPVLSELMAAHVGFSAELDLTERLADPVADRLDAVIRIGRLADSALIGTKLAPQRRVLVASKAYLENQGTPDNVAALKTHRLIDKLHGADLLGWTEILGHPAGAGAQSGIAFRSDDFEALRSAAAAGMGVAFLPSWVAGPDIRAGVLVQLPMPSEAWNEHPEGIHLLRALAEPPAKLRVFTEALRKHIGSPPIWER